MAYIPQYGKTFDPNARNPYGGYSVGVTDDDLELAKALAPFGSDEKKIAEQLARAKELRGTAMPEGLNPTGKIYTRASPFEFLNATVRQGLGAKGVRDAQDASAGMTQGVVGAMDRVLQEREAKKQRAAQVAREARDAEADATRKEKLEEEARKREEAASAFGAPSSGTGSEGNY